VDRLIGALASDEQRIPLDIPLPPNAAIALRLEQTGQRRSWWSIHELSVWSR